jgi:hypothetical protein
MAGGWHENMVRVWDIETSTLQVDLESHPEWINGCGFSPDGHQIVTGCKDGIVRVFDATTGNLLQEIIGHLDRVWAVTFHPSGRVVSAGGDGTVRLWDPSDGPSVLGAKQIGIPGVENTISTADLGGGRWLITPRTGAPVIVDAGRQEATTIDVGKGNEILASTVDRSSGRTAFATVQGLVECATATGLPVRGVLHAAASFEKAQGDAPVDAPVTHLNDELIDRCWAPNVYGAWNLHEATAGAPLDWFCVFSSAAAMVGSPGRGADAAANSWLDAFARWRRARGLPGTAIAWGAWAEAGGAPAEGAGVAITPTEGYRALKTLLRYDRQYSGYAAIVGTPRLSALAQRSRFAEAFRAVRHGGPDRATFLAELALLPREEWPSAVLRLVSDQTCAVLRRGIDPDRRLSDYGLDSLGNLDLRTRIETETGVRISPAMVTTVR